MINTWSNHPVRKEVDLGSQSGRVQCTGDCFWVFVEAVSVMVELRAMQSCDQETKEKRGGAEDALCPLT